MKTVLFLRSSFVTHCAQAFGRLRRSSSSPLRWIWIVQPRLENEFRKIWEGSDVTVWTYAHPRFTFRRLLAAFGESVSRERIDEAYVPVNNPEGRGYLQIILFLSAVARIRTIHLVTTDLVVRRVTLGRFLLLRVIGILASWFGTIGEIILSPFVLLYCLWACAVARRRRIRLPP